MLGEFNLPTREQKALHDKQNPKPRKWEDFNEPIKKPLANMLHIRVRIKDYLERFPNLKDDDLSLMATVWEYEIQDMKLVTSSGFFLIIHNMPTVDFMSLLADKNISNPETIRRTRQKLQQEWPHLRGKLWEARHNHSKVIKDIIVNSPEFYPGGTP